KNVRRKGRLRRCGINENIIILAGLIKEIQRLSAAFKIIAKRRIHRDRKKTSRSRSRSASGRRNKRHLAGASSRECVEPPQTLDQLKAVERLLSGIGVPKPSPFKPD